MALRGNRAKLCTAALFIRGLVRDWEISGLRHWKSGVYYASISAKNTYFCYKILPHPPKIRIFVTSKYFHTCRIYVFLFPENTSTLAKNTLFCHKYEFEVRARFFEVFGDDKFSIEAHRSQFTIGEPPVHVFHFVSIDSGHSLLHCPSLSLVAPTLKEPFWSTGKIPSVSQSLVSLCYESIWYDRMLFQGVSMQQYRRERGPILAAVPVQARWSLLVAAVSTNPIFIHAYSFWTIIGV